MAEVPKPKPLTEDQFKNKLDMTAKVIFNKTLPKDDLLMMLQKNIKIGEDAGIMSSKEALSFVKDRMKFFKEYSKENPMGDPPPKNFQTGGRVNFLEGGDTKYNAMVTEMYIKLGGKDGTGMDIDSFAEKYFKKFSTGGRVNYQVGGDADDRREQYAVNQYSKSVSSPTTDKFTKPPSSLDDNNNIITKIGLGGSSLDENLALGFQKDFGPFGLDAVINTLGILGLDDPRTLQDESEMSDYRIGGGFNTNLFGGNLNLGAQYDPKTGANLGLSFKKEFNKGGRVNYNEGSMDPDTLKLQAKVKEIMDIEGLDFGEAFKKALREIKAEARDISD